VTAGLYVRRLRVVAGGRLLLDVGELQIPEGALVVVSGAASSGKTVLAAALGGAVDSTGEVEVRGRRLEGAPSQRRRGGLAVSLRDGTRIVGCTVDEALTLASGGHQRRHEALDRFPALAARRAVLAQLLSGGEQQMLQVACSWSAEPAALVLDSPTVGLAEEVARAVSDLARSEAERGCSVLWLEQDQRAAPTAARYRITAGRLEAAAASVPATD